MRCLLHFTRCRSFVKITQADSLRVSKCSNISRSSSDNAISYIRNRNRTYRDRGAGSLWLRVTHLCLCCQRTRILDSTHHFSLWYAWGHTSICVCVFDVFVYMRCVVIVSNGGIGGSALLSTVGRCDDAHLGHSIEPRDHLLGILAELSASGWIAEQCTRLELNNINVIIMSIEYLEECKSNFVMLSLRVMEICSFGEILKHIHIFFISIWDAKLIARY